MSIVFNRYIPSMYYHSFSITVWGEVGNALKNNVKKINTNSIYKKQSSEWNYVNAWVMLLQINSNEGILIHKQIIDFDSC